MENLLKVGNRIINLDNVTEIVGVDTSLVRVLFNVATDTSSEGDPSNMQLVSTDFTGKEAEALSWWLKNRGCYADVVLDHQYATTCVWLDCDKPRIPGNFQYCEEHQETYVSGADIPF